MFYKAGIAIGPSQCTYSQHWTETTVVIGCVGVIDMLTAPELERHIAMALEKRPKALIVDLTDVVFLASHGINALLTTHHQCLPTTQFAVVADGPVTRRPMQLIGITDILTVHATVDHALNSSAL